ncbi:MAG: dTMP kinase [Sphingomonas sp. SCN 67-18]|uniref:dTMP kinase n=1 Tax=uncultured Sphingomonas sp. TaxID=158754 RepID=UPI000868EAC2|nr:dTMP kinase [Sphingomonas sp. SCN 67-18]ODU19819.1 MAG: dTMP kinase [Sphingomonas sp. SCN 67-18]
MDRIAVDLRVTGRFITLEGGEGVGKSTQARRIADALAARGIDAVITREPGGSPGAEAIRGLLLTGDAALWGPRAEALLFAAARADHVEKTIRPAIASGKWVICDRFLDSSRAYQGGASGLDDDDIMTLHRIGSDAFLPDRTLVLALPEDEAAARADARDGGVADRIGARDAAYHARVAAAFARYCAEDPARFRLIDASGAAEAVTARVMTAIADLLP